MTLWQIFKTKKITLCKIPGHMGIEDNKTADKAAKEAVEMPKITAKLPIKTIYRPLKRQETVIGRGYRKSVILIYTISYYVSKFGKVPTTIV